MRPGDKFDVGGKEYTFKDAIERAGMQLETFFNEEEASEDNAQEIAKAQEEAEKINTDLDRIKHLANIQ